MVHERQPHSWLMIEWWNQPGTFVTFDDGLQELAEAPADTEQGSALGPYASYAGDELRTGCGWWPANWISRARRTRWRAASELARGDSRNDGWDGMSSDRMELLLWGTDYQGNNDWAELRIPRLLHYPVTPEKKARLKREHTRSPGDDLSRCSRTNGALAPLWCASLLLDEEA